MKKEVISIFADGNELKVVYARKVKGKVKVLSFDRVKLYSPIEEKELATAETPIEEDYFASTDNDDQETDATHEKEDDNKDIFYDLLNTYSAEKAIIALNLPETNTGFVSVDNTSKKSKRKLTKQVINEIQKNFELVVEPDKLFLLPSSNGEGKAVFQRGGNPVLDIIEDIRPFWGKRLSVGLVEINEIALVNLVNRTYTFDEEDISVVIYIGNDFSRIIFMKGNKIASLVPVINEGYTSENILSRIYGKIMLERDESAFLDINRVVLAGEAQLIEAKKFFLEKFPNTLVSYISYIICDELNTSELEKKDREHLSAFAIPLSSAWKVLEPKYDGFLNDNFLPEEVKNRQKSLKIAWHGVIFIIALCAMFIYFFGQYLVMERKIENEEYTAALLENQIESAKEILTEMDKMQSEINHYNEKITRYNSLTMNCKMNSELLENLARNVKRTNSLWLSSLSIKNDGFSMSGESVFKSRVSKFVSSYEKYTLNIVNRFKVRNKEIYKFDLKGEESLPLK